MSQSQKSSSPVPADLLASVVAYFDSRRVILFGSQARGDSGPDSDIDLLVVMDDDAPAELVTLAAGYESRRGLAHATDIIPVRESVFQQRRHIIGTLSETASTEGRVLYEQPSCG